MEYNIKRDFMYRAEPPLQILAVIPVPNKDETYLARISIEDSSGLESACDLFHPRAAPVHDVSCLTISPGAMTSGLMRPSAVGPVELKKATVSMSVASTSGVTSPVVVSRVLPDVVAPTASAFFIIAGLFIVHESRTMSPSFPAANISKSSGFLCAERYEDDEEA